MDLTPFLTLFKNFNLSNWLSTPITLYGITFTAWLLLFSLMLYGKRKIAAQLATKTLPLPSSVQTFLAKAFKTLSPVLLLIIALALSSRFLTLPKTVGLVIHQLPLLGLLFQLAIWTKPLTQLSLSAYVESQQEEQAQLTYRTLMGPISIIIIATIWMALGLIALDNFNVNITGLVTGLGIGGIAIALAVKSILEDLFSAFAIVLDKPFVVGDFIALNDYKGTVEHIGLKTTRINALSGEQLIIANTDLLSSRIRNYRRMQERRVVQLIYVDFSTPLEQLEQLPNWIETLIKEQSEVLRLDRVHFTGVGLQGLIFELVYFVTHSDYTLHMTYQQTFFFALLKKLKEEGVTLAKQNLELLKT